MGSQSKSQLEAAAQNALLNIEDPTLFEEAQRAIKTKNPNTLLQSALRSLQEPHKKAPKPSTFEDEEDIPPDPFAPTTDRNNLYDDDEAPPPDPSSSTLSRNASL